MTVNKGWSIKNLKRNQVLESSGRLVLPEFVGRGMRLHAHKTALAFGSHTRSFAQLDARSDRLAGALVARGVRPGDRVALLLHNGLEFVETLLACHRAGAAAVPVNVRLAGDEVAYILGDSKAVGLVVSAELTDLVLAPPSVRLTVGEDYERALAETEPLGTWAEVTEENVALVMYTSGTTGRPKGALLSHRSLVMSTLSWIHELRATEDDVWLSGQPLFHIGGLNGLLPFLFVGATQVVLPTTGFDAEDAVRQLDAHTASMCIFVPTQWEQVCNAAASTGVNCSRLRIAMWGASSCPRATLELMARTFPRASIVSAYGQTETAGATTLLKGTDATRKLGSVGKPMLGVELRLVDDDGVDVPKDQVGEIVYRGPMLMSGYLGKDEASREAFTGGWFHSGDLARRDDEGYLYIVDRKKDLIVSGGENVYPAEIERVLLDHAAVADAAVVGVPHARWIETPVAFVVLVDGATASEGELVDHCRAQLAGYKKPSRVIFVERLPRNAGGKIMRRELRVSHAL